MRVRAGQAGFTVGMRANHVVVHEEVRESETFGGLGEVADDGRIRADLGLTEDRSYLHDGASVLIFLRIRNI